MYAVVRVRGLKHVNVHIRRTLEALQLDRKNHCVMVPEQKEFQGMLDAARDYVGFGSIKPETLARLLQKRGRLPGDKPLTQEFLKKNNLSSFDEMAKAVLSGKITLDALGIKPVFRLNAPRGGFSRAGTKKSVELKGPLGFHPNGIDPLMLKMM